MKRVLVSSQSGQSRKSFGANLAPEFRTLSFAMYVDQMALQTGMSGEVSAALCAHELCCVVGSTSSDFLEVSLALQMDFIVPFRRKEFGARGTHKMTIFKCGVHVPVSAGSAEMVDLENV